MAADAASSVSAVARALRCIAPRFPPLSGGCVGCWARFRWDCALLGAACASLAVAAAALAARPRRRRRPSACGGAAVALLALAAVVACACCLWKVGVVAEALEKASASGVAFLREDDDLARVCSAGAVAARPGPPHWRSPAADRQDLGRRLGRVATAARGLVPRLRVAVALPLALLSAAALPCARSRRVSCVRVAVTGLVAAVVLATIVEAGAMIATASFCQDRDANARAGIRHFMGDLALHVSDHFITPSWPPDGQPAARQAIWEKAHRDPDPCAQQMLLSYDSAVELCHEMHVQYTQAAQEVCGPLLDGAAALVLCQVLLSAGALTVFAHAAERCAARRGDTMAGSFASTELTALRHTNVSSSSSKGLDRPPRWSSGWLFTPSSA